MKLLDVNTIERNHCAMTGKKDLAPQKRLYRTHLMVQSPKILRKVMIPIVILMAGVYNNLIRSDIFKNINSETTFLE